MRTRERVLPALVGLALVTLACAEDGPIEQPRPLYGEEPIDYPIDLYDEGVEGEVLLKVRIDATGAVDSVEIEMSSGHVGLDSAAVRSIVDTEFSPARQNDEFIRAWAHVPIRFSTRPRTTTNDLR